MGDWVTERFRRSDQVVDVGNGQRPGERLETVGIRRRMVAEHPGKRYLPTLTLERYGSAATEPGHRRNDDRAVTVGVVGLTTVEPRRIAEVHVDPLLRGPGQAEGGEPVRAARTASGRVDDEVRIDELRPLAGHRAGAGAGAGSRPGTIGNGSGRSQDPHADDVPGSAGSCDKLGRGCPLDELHPRRPMQIPADDGLQQRSAGEYRDQPGLGRVDPQPPQIPAGTHQRLDRGSAPRAEFGGQAGKQFLHDLSAAVEQAVQVATLGHAATRVCLCICVGLGVGKDVPLEHGDPVEGCREHPGGEQPGDAGAQDDRVATAGGGRGNQRGLAPEWIISVGREFLVRLPDRSAVRHHASVAVLCSLPVMWFVTGMVRSSRILFSFVWPAF